MGRATPDSSIRNMMIMIGDLLGVDTFPQRAPFLPLAMRQNEATAAADDGRVFPSVRRSMWGEPGISCPRSRAAC